ncbi:MAG TPA: DNA polymerase I, partial [Gemmatimonadaceae bacterium]|nr:DNA polymerase I [Gemmatimonadaceae bacterium]
MTDPQTATASRPPTDTPRLFLVDGYALIYRAFFALIARPLTTSRGENTSAAWGIVNFIQRLFQNHRPEYVGWVHDSGLSFRHERYPAYKATREKLTDELQADFDRGMERITAILEASQIPILTVPGYEADDVIGTLTRLAVERAINVVVVSGDKDFQQLVRPGVWLLNPGRGGPASVEEHWVSVENGADRLGVPPALVTDYLALVGDASDNVPGVRGIGEKTAQQLVNSYGTLENIVAHATEITKKRPREALLEQRELALLSKELVTIRDDLLIDLDLAAMRVRPPHLDRLRELYVELEFHSLARQLIATPEPVAPTEPTARYVVVDDVADLADVVARARRAPHLAIHTEVVRDAGAPDVVDPLRSSLVGLSLAVAPGEAYYFPFAHADPQPPQGTLALGDETPGSGSASRKPVQRARSAAPTSIAARALAAKGADAVRGVRNLPPLTAPSLRPLQDLLEDPSVEKTAHNGKFDLLVLRTNGVDLRGLAFDTMIGSYVLDPGRRSHDLDLLTLEFLGHTLTSMDQLCGRGKDAIPFREIPIECARDYCGELADVTWQLRREFEPQLEALQLMSLFREIEMPLTRVLAEMEWEGVAIDLAWFASLKERFAGERQRIEREIYDVAGHEFNINSTPQLREILFERLGLPILKRTSTGPSTDASVLQQLADEGHTLPALLMDYREIAKLESTYVDALPALVNPRTGRLHTSFSQTVAATGRLSSSDPNLQNIPIRRELGRDIRRGFVPRAGCVFLAADYSQIELRLLAHLSQDPAFVSAFNAGGDIHRQTAALIFDVPIDAVTGEMRGRAKTINFATIYGQGAHALSRQLRVTHAEAKAFIEQYFERFGRIRAFLDSQVEFAREHGYVVTLFGR